MAYLIVAIMLFGIWSNFIPVMSPVSYRMDLIYPPSEQELTRNVIYVRTTVSSYEGFAERTRIKIHAVGSIADGFAENVSQIQVFFKGAFYEMYLQPSVVGPQPLSLVGQPSAGVYLVVTKNYPNEPMALVSSDAVYLVSYEDALVQWMTQGDYNPTLIIIFKNDSHIIQDYQQFRLHIEPYSTLESEKTGLKFYWTGGVAFAVVTLMQETLSTVSKLRKPRIRPLIRRLRSRLSGKSVTYTPSNARHDKDRDEETLHLLHTRQHSER